MCCCFSCCCDCFLVFLAIILPPLPVMIKRGCCACDVLINICLCLLGYIPGLIHSWYIIARYPEVQYEDEERLIAIRSPGCNHPQTIIVHQPAPITFNNPEPFSQDHPHPHHHGVPQRQLSPLSSSVNPNANYGSLLNTATDNNNKDDHDNSVPPPSYDKVMNETVNQYKH